jgi:hypothetical protein
MCVFTSSSWCIGKAYPMNLLFFSLNKISETDAAIVL